ncbi:LysR family transcriptional regulator [Xinfangfangia sp. D13-10-4-6]|uniref:LysR family transcriptional regulator n=1 Tax=Pseudogemmobacter hezensis TaxID=2737662 RepID=UPI001557A24A|nr:LysR family transcriptional regulator [Pseudogemmobacter hezensis]NPD15475.1 LysR family transcriptional regulator [Pseudogemmobacter hezensis]
MGQPNLESDLMRGFLAVAESGSVTLAAARIGRTQSAVSLMIRRLEDNLGQPLFERQARGVTLTARGEQLLPYAQRVVALLDEAALALREKPLTGPVRVGIPDEYSGTILPRALAAFDERHEGLQVSVLCDHSDRQLIALEEDRLDIAVIHDTSYFQEGELLTIDPSVWVTSITHMQHLRSPVPVAVYLHSEWCREFAEASLNHQGMRWRRAWYCDVASGMRNAVTNGMAISPLSRSTIPAGCRELTAEEGFPAIDSARVLLRRNPRGTSPAIEGMAAVLREAFRPLTVARTPGAAEPLSPEAQALAPRM